MPEDIAALPALEAAADHLLEAELACRPLPAPEFPASGEPHSYWSPEIRPWGLPVSTRSAARPIWNNSPCIPTPPGGGSDGPWWRRPSMRHGVVATYRCRFALSRTFRSTRRFTRAAASRKSPSPDLRWPPCGSTKGSWGWMIWAGESSCGLGCRHDRHHRVQRARPHRTGPGTPRPLGGDGRLTFRRPAETPELVLDGWVIPGLVDAHCHIGLGQGGDVPEDTAEAQALTDRDAGTLLVRDAGAVHDTRWLQQRADLPRIIRAGRHIARTRRYLPGLAVEVEPEDLSRPCGSRPARATAGSSSWGTGSTATPATSARAFRPGRSRTPSGPPTTRGSASPPTASPKTPWMTCSTPGSTASSTPPGCCRGTCRVSSSRASRSFPP